MTTKTIPIVIPTTIHLTSVENLFSKSHQLFDQYRTVIFAITGTVMTAWLYNKLWVNRKFYPSMQLMQGKTVLITGGNAGIGYETVKDLLRRGARVIIACRNMNKGQQAIEKLKIESGCETKNIRLMECDLCSLESVRHFARLYNAEEERLDVLICNAGVVWSELLVTKNGFNAVIQSNYLGHFLLTNLLLDKLKECRPSRIINVSSNAHRMTRSIDWSDVFTQLKSGGLFSTYAASKAYQILSTYKLKKDLFAEGIDVFSLTPGWVWTSIHEPLRKAVGFYQFLIFYPIMRIFKIAFAKTPKTGARTTIYCAVEPSLERSPILYFENCAAAKVTPFCTDATTADELWKLSTEVIQ